MCLPDASPTLGEWDGALMWNRLLTVTAQRMNDGTNGSTEVLTLYVLRLRGLVSEVGGGASMCPICAAVKWLLFVCFFQNVDGII